MIRIRTSVQARGSIVRNAAALEPVQDGDHYTYTIHTPLEPKLEKAVTFQIFITIPKTLESLESFTIQGANLELSIGNISHTFIKNLSVSTHRGDTTIEVGILSYQADMSRETLHFILLIDVRTIESTQNFYGESADIKSVVHGDIWGKYSVARLYARATAGKITSNVHLLNTDESQPSPKVLCSTLNYPVNVAVDGTDLFGPFTVEAKTQCQPLDVKISLADEEQCLRGNFINFGAPTRIKLSRNYQGRIETRTHYGKITVDDPGFQKLHGAMLSLPSASDRNAGSPPTSLSMFSSPSVYSLHSLYQSTATSPSMIFSPENTPWDDSLRHNYQAYHSQHSSQSSQSSHAMIVNSTPGSAVVSEASSRANSIHDSMTETRSICTVKSEKGRKKKKKGTDEDSIVTRELIGTIGDGDGLLIAKNSSGDIAISLM